MENLIYWKGKAVGMECGSYISWFASASPEAIAALTEKSQFEKENEPRLHAASARSYDEAKSSKPLVS